MTSTNSGKLSTRCEMPQNGTFLETGDFFGKCCSFKVFFVKINRKDLVAEHVFKCLLVYTACKNFFKFSYLQKIDKDHTLVGSAVG